MNGIFKVIKQCKPTLVNPTESENFKFENCTIVLQEFGGKYANSFVCTLFGNAAHCKFYPGETVLAKLGFRAYENNGKFFQDISVIDIEKLTR